MGKRRRFLVCSVLAVALLASARDAGAQSQTDESRWVLDLGVGIDATSMAT
jgi:hypothetical protein